MHGSLPCGFPWGRATDREHKCHGQKGQRKHDRPVKENPPLGGVETLGSDQSVAFRVLYL